MVFAMLPGFLMALYERHGQPPGSGGMADRPVLLSHAERAALPDQQCLYRPCAAATNGKGGKCHCSKSKETKRRKERPVKLTRAEKKEIQAVIRKYKGDGKPHSAQESIPYEAMYQDGICRLTPRRFSKCIEFADISYQLAQADTKTAIFENLCDLYNYLDASIHHPVFLSQPQD